MRNMPQHMFSISHSQSKIHEEHYSFSSTGRGANNGMTRIGVEKIQYKDETNVLSGGEYPGFECFMGGNTQITINNVCYDLPPGSLVFLPKNNAYQLKITGNKALTRYYCAFEDASGFESFFTPLLPNLSEPIQIKNLRWAHQILEQLIDCAKAPCEESSELCMSLLSYFFKRIATEQKHQKRPVTHAQKQFQKVQSFIQDNYRTINRISDVSKRCFLSLPHLSRLFKQFSNETPSELLNRLKLEKAAEMLAMGEYMVKEVSKHVGYEDALYFSNRFKKYFGVSPKYYTQASLSSFPIVTQQVG